MRSVIVLISVLACLSILAIATPLDLLETRDTPVKAVSLANIDPSSAWKIAESNPKLVKQPRWKIPDIGYLTSEVVAIDQDAENLTASGVPDKLIKFSLEAVEFPESIENSSINETNITVINETFVWF